MAATITSLKKLKGIIDDKKLVTPSKLVQMTNLPTESVKSVIDYLVETNQIELISNGNFTLIRNKQEVPAV